MSAPRGPSRAALFSVLLCGFVLAAGLPAAQDEGAEKWIETVVPRMESAEAQLAHARRLKRQMLAKEGAELDFWRKTTVEAYQAVRVFHGGARGTSTEAAFRAGEILRAGGDEAGALAEFRWVVQRGEPGEFRARAGLEIGHLERRAERWREALEAYSEVVADRACTDERREDAALWVGASWKALGRVPDARLAWTRVAEQGVDPLARIRAFDELGLLFVEAGDLEAAAGVLDRCLVGLSPRALEETEEGERVRNALLRMRLVDELPRALARKRALDGATGTTGKS